MCQFQSILFVIDGSRRFTRISVNSTILHVSSYAINCTVYTCTRTFRRLPLQTYNGTVGKQSIVSQSVHFIRCKNFMASLCQRSTQKCNSGKGFWGNCNQGLCLHPITDNNFYILFCIKKKSNILRSTETQVYVVTAQNGLVEKRLEICKLLWENKIKVNNVM